MLENKLTYRGEPCDLWELVKTLWIWQIPRHHRVDDSVSCSCSNAYHKGRQSSVMGSPVLRGYPATLSSAPQSVSFNQPPLRAPNNPSTDCTCQMFNCHLWLFIFGRTFLCSYIYLFLLFKSVFTRHAEFTAEWEDFNITFVFIHPWSSSSVLASEQFYRENWKKNRKQSVITNPVICECWDWNANWWNAFLFVFAYSHLHCMAEELINMHILLPVITPSCAAFAYYGLSYM